MDPVAVDHLSRVFATPGTRRRLMALLGLLPVAGTISALQTEQVEAGGRRRRRKRRHDPGEDKQNRKGKRKGKHKGQHQQEPPPAGCVPKPQSTCADESRVCGAASDGCGGTLNCGSCGVCQTCNDAGQCVADPAQNRTTCDGSGAATSICCNGECCAGCCNSAGACGACRVFVTSARYDGNLKGSSASGLAGADDKCQQLANSVNPPLPGDYLAWLSDSTSSPSTRFRCSATSCSSKGYVLVDGTTVVADDWADLTTCSDTGPAGPGTAGCIDNAIRRTESNVRIDSQENAWTHTKTDGTAGGTVNGHCLDWSSNDSGQSGDYAVPAALDIGDKSWTQFDAQPCNGNQVRLYCFQQR
jgi:hypothetical protein